MRRSVRSWILVVIVTALTATARADGHADEAEADFRMAVARFQAGDYEGALAWFMASNRLAPNPNVQFNVARTFDALNRLPEAHRWYVEALAGATTDAQRNEIRQSLDRLESRVAIVEVVTDPPGATMFLDRRELGSIGRTPSRVAIAAGAHRMLVELEGYEPVPPTEFTAVVGRVATVQLTLRRIVGRVRIQGDEGVEVLVDRDEGDAACVLPCELAVEPGIHMIRGRREGYRFEPVAVRVEANRTVDARVSGSARTGSLVITADERDATVEIDGTAVGFTPAVLPSVAVGERRVRITLEGYEPIERTVTVVESQQTDLRDLRLVPERVVTTASRVAESFDDSPASLSVVTAQELAAFRYPTIAEALRGLRGVSLTNDSSYDGVTLRGLGQANDYGNRLLVLQDGAVLNDNLLYQSYVGFDGRVDLGDVQRIELVRGPGSVLYGTGAVSGLVNLIHRQADRPTEASATASTIGNVGRGRGDVHVRLPNGGGFDASVSGAFSNGRSATVEPRDGSGAVRIGDIDRFFAYTSTGRLHAGDFSLQWMANHRSQALSSGSFGTTLGDPRTRYRDTRAMLEARYEPHLGDHAQLFLRAVGNYALFDGDYFYDDGAGTTSVSEERYVGGWMVGEARVVIAPSESFRISVGGEVQASVRASLHGIERGETDPYLDADNPYQIFSAYALAEVAPIRWLRLNAGLRADVYNTANIRFETPYALSPRLASIFRIGDGGVLKLMGGRAFRAPSTYELLYQDGGISQVAAPTGSLAPETVWSAEVEYSHRIAADWVVLGSAYYQRARDFVVTTESIADPALVVYANSADRIRMLGADAEIRKEWRDGWMLSAMVGYLDARYEGAPSFGATSNTRVAGQPRTFASARTVVPFGRSNSELAFRATLEGKRRIDLDANDTTDVGVVIDTVISGEAFDDHLTWAFGVYDLFGFRRQLPIGDSYPMRVLTQPGRRFFAELRFSY